MQHGLQPTTLSNDLKLAHRTVKNDVNSVGIIKDKSPDIARNMNKHLTCLRNGDTHLAFLFSVLLRNLNCVEISLSSCRGENL